MKRIRFTSLACLAVFALAPAAAFASPTPTCAVIKQRIFNDCTTSTVTTGNSYPGSLFIQDAFAGLGVGCTGGANLHNWRFAVAPCTAPVLFNNADAFRYSTDLTITGTGNGEAGLQVSPWWSPDVDGRFNVRTSDGEIACFGGVLPFYSFTAREGLHYVKGDPIHLEINYLPRSGTPTDPGVIVYKLVYLGIAHTSGTIPFNNQSPPSEDPIYGSYGILNQARVGGHIQLNVAANTNLRATWANITYNGNSKPLNVPASSPVNQVVLGVGLLMLGGLVIAFRRKLMPAPPLA